MFRVILGLVLAWLAVSGPARACSVTADYFVPLNYDLVGWRIPLFWRGAMVIGSASRPAILTRFDSKLWKQSRALPGPDEIIIRNAWGSDDPEVLARRSDHTSLNAVHPDVHSGPCDRVSFPRTHSSCSSSRMTANGAPELPHGADARGCTRS